MNITKNPHTKNKNVLNINPTSAETVVSAEAGITKHRKNAAMNRKKVFLNINIKLLN
tara:strand:- start:98 stop:268 length:171 start_codon:yes stop_codon:yes gene_type:complete